MNIILASASPRRKELLSYITQNFEVIVSNADENFEEGLTIQEQSKQIAYAKAKAVFDITKGDRIVIGSDTLVLKDGKHYGKPATEQEAFQMIEELQGKAHEVITSISILVEEQGKQTKYLDYDITKVYVSNMTPSEIQNWIDKGQAMDKAGAYAIQGEFAKFIEKIEGDYTTVMGLPVCKVYQALKQYLD